MYEVCEPTEDVLLLLYGELLQSEVHTQGIEFIYECRGIFREEEETEERGFRARSFLLRNMDMQFDYIKQGDCLELMRELPDESIDMILCDLPYGTTKGKWDFRLDTNFLWTAYHRVIKRGGAILLFGVEPFSSLLRCSNLSAYKYDWIWDKEIPSGMCNAKIQPMRQTENISVFIDGHSYYYPQMIRREKSIHSGGMRNSESGGTIGLKRIKKTYEEKYPTTLLRYPKVRKGTLHPTQKPVPLLEYLIKTYTNEGDVVLDNCMGSGSTCVACINTGRHYIGYELDEGYFEVSRLRIEKAKEEKGKEE